MSRDTPVPWEGINCDILSYTNLHQKNNAPVSWEGVARDDGRKWEENCKSGKEESALGFGQGVRHTERLMTTTYYKRRDTCMQDDHIITCVRPGKAPHEQRTWQLRHQHWEWHQRTANRQSHPSSKQGKLAAAVIVSEANKDADVHLQASFCKLQVVVLFGAMKTRMSG